MDDKLWLLEKEEEERILLASAGDSSIDGDLPNWEGSKSIFKILEVFRV
jgi:hypothetical protein